MSQSPSTSWGERLLAGMAQRTAMAVVAGVTFAAVAPSLANAAGAGVPDPVAIALRSGREALSEALGTAEPSCPTDEVAGETGSEGDVTGATGPEGDVTGATGPLGETGPEAPAETVEEADCDDEVTTTDDDTEEAEQEEAVETDADSEGHGAIVSTVARCAPRGKDLLLS